MLVFPLWKWNNGMRGFHLKETCWRRSAAAWQEVYRRQAATAVFPIRGLPNEKSYRPWSKANCFGAVQFDDKAQLKSVSVRREAQGARQDGQSGNVFSVTVQINILNQT